MATYFFLKNIGFFNVFTKMDIANSIGTPVDMGNVDELNIAPVNNIISNFEELTIQDLRTIIFSQENKGSVDSIDFKFLKDNFYLFGYPLLNIINRSLLSGEFPNQLNTSTIRLIPKYLRQKMLRITDLYYYYY